MIVNNKGKYQRENWKEWFCVFVSHGYSIPRFYLPVDRVFDRHGCICWIFPLAP